MSNLRRNIYIKAQIKAEAPLRDFFFLSSLPISCSFFPPGIPFPLCHIPPSRTIFSALLEHDKSERGVMTRDPLLALRGGRKGKKERKKRKERANEGRRGNRGREKMKEICLEIIAHKALILRFNLTQCAQISY